MSHPFTNKSVQSNYPRHNGVDSYGGNKDIKGGGQNKNKFDDDVYPTAKLPKGVNMYGGSVVDVGGRKTTMGHSEILPTAALPKGVDEHGGVCGNQQTAKKVKDSTC